MPGLCEACERNVAVIVEPFVEPDGGAYRICGACHRRLLARALRPVEWYNLVKRHGHSALLHDDFYDENGLAEQPEIALVQPERFPAPMVVEVRGDPGALLDYSITRWYLTPDVEEAWAGLSKPDVLAALVERFAARPNPEVRSRILEIIAVALGPFGEEFVRWVWREHSGSVDLLSLGRASAVCLPYREGFNLVVGALRMPTARVKTRMLALGYFRSVETLDWIEENVGDTVVAEWGMLASVSSLSWSRVEHWLEIGRPLSLVALDALVEIVGHPGGVPRELVPELAEPPSADRMREVLSEYAGRDSIPRVRQRVAVVLDRYRTRFE
jgi:hypothetical protein